MFQVTFKQLRYFDALARLGHFGRAAAACTISQPALSMQIKELEEGLGGVLIERGARRVGLTQFGEEVAQRARDILRSVDELGDFARASRDLLVGRLRIGMIPTIAPYLLPTIIGTSAESSEAFGSKGCAGMCTPSRTGPKLSRSAAGLPLCACSTFDAARWSSSSGTFRIC